MGTSEVRITTQVLKVLGALIAATDEISGADVARSTELASGTLYPILLRLEKSRWIESQWEKGDPRELGRPRRRLYSVTALGAKKARAAFKEIRLALGKPAWSLS
jgi:PadR family transcriptional regulator PadR